MLRTLIAAFLFSSTTFASLPLSDLLEANRGQSTSDDVIPAFTTYYTDYGTGAEGGFGRDIAGFFENEFGEIQGWAPVDPPGIKFHDSIRFERGIGAHPDSRIDFNLDAIRADFGQVNQFTATVGIDELTRTNETGIVFDAFGATFDVFLDDSLVGSYSIADGQTAPSLSVDLPISPDDQTLSLRTGFYDLSEINTNHAAWADARLHITEDLIVDIRPGSPLNPINLTSNGVLPVRVYGTSGLNLVDVDVDSLLFGDPDLIAAGAAPVSPLRAKRHDVTNDGFADLSLKFSIDDLVNSGVLDTSSTEATLFGSTFGGIAVEGSDNVTIVPKHTHTNAVPEPSSMVFTFMLPVIGMSMRRRRVSSM